MSIRSIILVSAIVILSKASPLFAQEDDDLLLTMPAILAATKEPEPDPFPPEWGVFNEVCCPTSRATFSVTLNGVTKRSTSPSCNAGGEASFEGFSTSTPGLKNFSSTLRASTCPDLGSNFQIDFAEDTRYLIQIELQNGAPTIVLFTQEITEPSPKKSGETSLPAREGLTQTLTLPMTFESKGANKVDYQAVEN